MKSMTEPAEWEWEKRPKGPKKGTDKVAKHRKSIYNMLSDYDEDEYSDEEFDSETDVRGDLDNDNNKR